MKICKLPLKSLKRFITTTEKYADIFTTFTELLYLKNIPNLDIGPFSAAEYGVLGNMCAGKNNESEDMISE